MKSFLLFILLYASFYKKSYQENVLCAERSSQIVPNVISAYDSVDITKLDMFQNISVDAGFEGALFDCSLKSKRYWHNPILPGSKYLIPDEIPRIYLDSFGEFSERVTIHKNVDTLMTSLSINAGVSVDAQAYGAYSLSGAFKTAKENILKNDCTIVEITAVVSSYAVEMVPYVFLNTNSNFQLIIDELINKTYEKKSRYYKNFLEDYGTHYFSSLRLGGLVIMSSLVENSYLSTTDSTEVFAQIGASFKKIVGINLSFNGTRNETTEIKNEHIHHSTRMFGGKDLGKTGLKSTEDFNNWLISVQENPFPFGGKLVPITNLVRNAEVREQLKIAINVKLNIAFLENMKETLYTIGHRFHKIISKIENCLIQVIPKSSDMQEIKATVDELTKDYLLKRERVGSRTADAFNNLDMEKLLELQVRGTISKAINSK